MFVSNNTAREEITRDIHILEIIEILENSQTKSFLYITSNLDTTRKNQRKSETSIRDSRGWKWRLFTPKVKTIVSLHQTFND